MNDSTRDMHLCNKARWEAAATPWTKGADSRGLWPRCPTEPELVLCARELECLGDLSGRRVCVLGSGDNQVVFALAGLGASVTSVDISQNQLDVAQERAKRLGLDVSFVCADVADLSVLADDAFDVVYTGGHVAVWVADLQRYYREAARILRPGGTFMIDEYHPFRRIWRATQEVLAVESPYLERGPFEYNLSDKILRNDPGPYRCFMFHWTIADYINAVLSTGCELTLVEEHGEAVAEWEGAPMHGLPEFLLIVARKPCGQIDGNGTQE